MSTDLSMKKLLEKDIQRQILDYLKLKGVFHYKQNTTGIYKKSTGSYIPSPSVGAPDIVCVLEGKYVGIEVKTKTGVQSGNQKAFEEGVVAAGGKYIIARSVEDVVEGLLKVEPKNK